MAKSPGTSFPTIFIENTNQRNGKSGKKVLFSLPINLSHTMKCYSDLTLIKPLPWVFLMIMTTVNTHIKTKTKTKEMWQSPTYVGPSSYHEKNTAISCTNRHTYPKSTTMCLVFTNRKQWISRRSNTRPCTVQETELNAIPRNQPAVTLLAGKNTWISSSLVVKSCVHRYMWRRFVSCLFKHCTGNSPECKYLDNFPS